MATDKQEITSTFENLLNQVNHSLANFEKVSTIVVIEEPWTEDNNLLTPTLKVKRNKIDEKYMNNYSQWHQDNCSIVWKN